MNKLLITFLIFHVVFITDDKTLRISFINISIYIYIYIYWKKISNEFLEILHSKHKFFFFKEMVAAAKK